VDREAIMSITYAKLVKKPLIFLRIAGVTPTEFQQMCERVAPLWQTAIEAQKQCAGRTATLTTFEDKLLALLVYYRTYITHEFVGYLFGLHSSNVCRLFKKLEPLVARKITIKKDRSLTADVLIKLLADVTEQPIQRPQRAKKRKPSYSGKKKRHTHKIELVMQANGQILSVSHSHPGRKHDFRIRKEETPLPRAARKYVDLGYQGLQKLTQAVVLPFKRKKGQSLSAEQKQHNRAQASQRMPIEHKIRELKVFKILSETYRNFGKKHHLRFNIIAGIINLRYGF
jgi:hypothetical protein